MSEVDDMMEKLVRKYGDYPYLAFRVLVGGLFFMVGSMKLFGWFASLPEGISIPVGSLAWFAGLIEVIVGPLVVLGLLARYAAGVAAIEMVIAYLIGHAIPNGWNPLTNGGQPALLFLAAFLALLAKGAGRWAVDRR
jgi:putative oxidoreductase